MVCPPAHRARRPCRCLPAHRPDPDLASIDLAPSSNGADRIFIEISQLWPPNEANVLEPATWRLELLVCGDNISPSRSFVTLSLDASSPQTNGEAIWDHFVVQADLTA